MDKDNALETPPLHKEGEAVGMTFARVAHLAALKIRPEISGDAEYWRLRSAVHDALLESAAPVPVPVTIPNDEMVLVPREPTSAMRLAGLEQKTTQVAEIYRAMVAAALPLKPGEQG